MVTSEANAERRTPNSESFREQAAQRRTPAVVLTIAGSDSSAGAGIQADLKTFSAFGVYGLTAITCVVAEVPGKVRRIEGVPAEVVREQIEVLFASFPIAAVKTGLLRSREIVETIANTLQQCITKSGRAVPIVIDPVMVATSGDLLLLPGAVEAYERKLFPLAAVVTPNLDEAATLLGREVRDRDAMRAAGRELRQKYGVSFLLKGGHLGGEDALDLLFDGQSIEEFSAPFAKHVSTHGTGCTYSAAITAGLGHGLRLGDAVREAKYFVTETIARYLTWTNGTGAAVHALNHWIESCSGGL